MNSWDEITAKRGFIEIISSIVTFIQKTVSSDIKELNIFQIIAVSRIRTIV